MHLLSHIKALEVLSNQERYDYIIQQLELMEIPYLIHHYPSGNNILIPAKKKPVSLVSAHFDKVPNSPGANDNASAIAVCLGLLELQQRETQKHLEIIIFDEEETGLKGSRAYIAEYGVMGYQNQYNLEMLGQGDRLALWPLGMEATAGQTAFEKAAQQFNILTYQFPKLLSNTGDHQSFREAGLKDAISITTIQEKDLDSAIHYFKALEFEASQEVLEEIMHKAPLFEHYHKPTDRSEHLNEDSLQNALKVLWQAIKNMR